ALCRAGHVEPRMSIQPAASPSALGGFVFRLQACSRAPGSAKARDLVRPPVHNDALLPYLAVAANASDAGFAIRFLHASRPPCAPPSEQTAGEVDQAPANRRPLARHLWGMTPELQRRASFGAAAEDSIRYSCARDASQKEVLWISNGRIGSHKWRACLRR